MSDSPKNIDFSDFNDNQLTVIAWLALPKSKRKPKIQRQLADEIGITEDTISLWKRDSAFRKAVQSRIESEAIDHDSEIIAALVRNAILSGQGSSSDRKLYLQWRNWLVENSKTEIVIDPYSEVMSKLRKEREIAENG